MREILKEMGLKISMISEQLGITRPTLYKFIEMFDSGKSKDIKNKKVKKLFKFIEKNKYSSPNLVIDYIINDLNVQGEHDQKKRELISIIKELPDEQVDKLLDSLREENKNE